MDLIKETSDALNNKGANGCGHFMADIIRNVNENTFCEIKYVIINNTVFRFFDDSTTWVDELNRFCSVYDINFSISSDSTTFIFYNKDYNNNKIIVPL